MKCIVITAIVTIAVALFALRKNIALSILCGRVHKQVLHMKEEEQKKKDAYDTLRGDIKDGEIKDITKNS